MEISIYFKGNVKNGRYPRKGTVMAGFGGPDFATVW
jgi:hypothetical protein